MREHITFLSLVNWEVPVDHADFELMEPLPAGIRGVCRHAW